MKMRLINCISSLLFILLPASLHADNVIVEVSCDSVQLWIGEQTEIHLSVTCDAGQKVSFPSFGDTIVNGLEIVPPVRTDTVFLNHRKRTTVTRSYTVTSFDSAFFYVPGLEVYVDSLPYRSRDDISLAVYMLPVDTTNLDAFYGPKDIMEVPVEWQDVKTSVYSILLLLLCLAAAIFLFIGWKNDKPIIRIIKVEPKKPAHEVAFAEIERIRQQQLAHGEDAKEYYTQLTDAVRAYMNERFGFNATEMTSDEIIENMLRLRDRESLTELKELLQTSDLVKFAKVKPLLGENDRNLVTAMEFVKETMSQEEPMPQKSEDRVVVERKRSKGVRALLLSCVIVLGLAACVFLFILIREVYFLLF